MAVLDWLSCVALVGLEVVEVRRGSGKVQGGYVVACSRSTETRREAVFPIPAGFSIAECVASGVNQLKKG